MRLALRPAPPSSPAGAPRRALRREARLVRAGETFPHKAAEGFIRLAALETELPPRGGARLVDAYDALAGRVGAGLAPEVWAFLTADDAELLPYDCEATLVHADGCTRPGCSTTTSSPRPSALLGGRSRARARGRGRPSAIERLLGEVAGRSTPGARGTTRSRRRSGSTSRDAAARR